MGKFLLDTAKIFLGTLCMALAVNLVYEPMGMVTGGVSGLAIVIKELTGDLVPGGIPVWLSNITINLPIFALAYFVKGKRFPAYTFMANIIFTVFLGTLPIVALQEKDYFLAAVTGGILTGVGLGIVFATGYSTGGTDLLGIILHQWRKEISAPTILFFIDGMVIATGMFLFGVSVSIYAILAVFLTSKVMDSILSGLKVGKQIWIVSENYEEISQEILEELERGVTCLAGKGMYSGRERNVLLCVVGRREVVKITRLVRRIDPDAFVILQDASEVMGEGFQKIE